MKLKIIIIVFILLIITLPLSLWVWWKYTQNKEIEIFVLDKTVLNKSMQEHIAFFWFLKNNKYTHISDKLYNPETDYFGFYPDGKGNYTIHDIEKLSKLQIDSLSNVYDMAYYTDVYGIYKNEWYHEYPNVKRPNNIGLETDRSPMIYGGLSQNEFDFLKSLKSKNKLIINEFNVFATPTKQDIRKQYEDEFHIQWSGWVGRYFESLDTNSNKEIPQWVIKNYKKQNNNTWPFSNSGIVLVKNDETIVILENKTSLNTEVPMIITESTYSEYYKIPYQIKYPFWFDICSTDSTNHVISYYSLAVNAKGNSILAKHNIPEVFPAVISSNGLYPYYYFAGDFSDVPISLKSASFKNIELFHFMFYDSSILERNSFFWKFYNPLLTKIMEDYYTSIKK